MNSYAKIMMSMSAMISMMITTHRQHWFELAISRFSLLSTRIIFICVRSIPRPSSSSMWSCVFSSSWITRLSSFITPTMPLSSSSWRSCYYSMPFCLSKIYRLVFPRVSPYSPSSPKRRWSSSAKLPFTLKRLPPSATILLTFSASVSRFLLRSFTRFLLLSHSF